jgi:hypothetical protein
MSSRSQARKPPESSHRGCLRVRGEGRGLPSSFQFRTLPILWTSSGSYQGEPSRGARKRHSGEPLEAERVLLLMTSGSTCEESKERTACSGKGFAVWLLKEDNDQRVVPDSRWFRPMASLSSTREGQQKSCQSQSRILRGGYGPSKRLSLLRGTDLLVLTGSMMLNPCRQEGCESPTSGVCLVHFRKPQGKTQEPPEFGEPGQRCRGRIGVN